MRTLLLNTATLLVFATFGAGCGGCVDDKGAPGGKPAAQGVEPTRVTHVRLNFDAGGGAFDPAAAGDK